MSGRWVDPDFYWCGPSPPTGDWSPDDWVELPHESYIPISKARLNEALLSHPGGRAAGGRLTHFLRLVEGLYHFQHHETLNQLKQDYEIFSPDADEGIRAGLADDGLAARELRFIANFMKATILGNFTAMSDADYRRAIAQSYLLDVPVEIDWRRHDTAMLERFFEHADGPEGQALRAELGVAGSLRDHLSLPEEIGTRAVVFYRGIDRDRARGRFLPQRLDLLFNTAVSLIAWPILKPIQAILESRRRSASGAGADGRAAGARGTLFERRWVRRRNLHNLGALRRLFRTVELQEPVLRQVLILFRLAGDPTIHLKMFRNIPLADSEMIFPQTIIRMGSFDRAMLVMSVGAAVFALGRLIAAGSAGFGGAALALLIGGGMLVARTVGRYLNVRRKYMARMTRNLYEKNLDNSVGVLQYLVDSLEEQEYKEAVLVYYVMWTEAREMSEADIDGAVEEFVHARLGGVEIDFEVDDALRKVVDLGIVVAEGDRFRALELDDALRVLDERWDGLFRFDRDARRARC